MKKLLHAEIPLLTPNGKTIVPIEITYDDSEVIANPKSEITLLYNEIEYKGYGADYLWTDTIADLQTKLPNDVKLACCMTCRHGNMCPYGNEENQLICTKGITITSKGDMLDLFDQTNPFEERAVASLDFCEDFVYQSDDYYTYNDYFYQLSRKMADKQKIYTTFCRSYPHLYTVWSLLRRKETTFVYQTKVRFFNDIFC